MFHRGGAILPIFQISKMEKVNFTPGTWSVRTNPFSANPIIESNLGDFSKFVAHLPAEESEPDELAANAALISAAPDLLESVMAALDFLKDIDLGGERANDIIKQCQSAILKSRISEMTSNDNGSSDSIKFSKDWISKLLK